MAAGTPDRHDAPVPLAPADAGSGGGAHLLHTFEGDRRSLAGQGHQYPWYALCHLASVWSASPPTFGTGVLIAPRVVLTAGHNLFAAARGGVCRSIRVAYGYDGFLPPLGVATAVRFASVEGWTKAGQDDADYGAVFLPEPVRLGKLLEPVALDDQAIASERFVVAGYPLDRALGSLWRDEGSALPVSGSGGRLLAHRIDTAPGQSGAPLLCRRDHSYRVAAIHVDGSPAGNRAVRLTPAALETVLGWMAAPP